MYSECSLLYKPVEQANASVIHENLGQGCALYDRHPINIVGRDESLSLLLTTLWYRVIKKKKS